MSTGNLRSNDQLAGLAGYNDVLDDAKMGWSRYIHSMRVFVFNSGLFYIRPTLASLDLLDRIAYRLDHEDGWDQAIFNEVSHMCASQLTQKHTTCLFGCMPKSENCSQLTCFLRDSWRHCLLMSSHSICHHKSCVCQLCKCTFTTCVDGKLCHEH